MRAPYVNPEGFRFNIYRAGWLSNIAGALGAQDVRIGDEAFDDAYVIKATDEARGRQLLTPAIQALLLNHPKLCIKVDDAGGWFSGHSPEGVDELSMYIPSLVYDLDLLTAAFKLFAAVLHRLCEMGTAYESAPGVVL